jgi:undecaprenyl-diphosphatase
MTLLHSFLLGIIQGLTEFIPISSTAHLLIAQRLLGVPANDAKRNQTTVGNSDAINR